MIIGCNTWIICLKFNWFFYDLSRMLQLSEFVWALRSSVYVVFNNFLLIDATDRSKINSDQKRLYFAVSLYPLSFFTYTPFNYNFFYLLIKLWRWISQLIFDEKIQIIASIKKYEKWPNIEMYSSEFFRCFPF